VRVTVPAENHPDDSQIDPDLDPAELGQEGEDAERPSGISAGRLDALSRELSRDLPCVRCGYDLVGLSVRDRCPECGTPVRATLLAVVDPLAGELAPIYAPRLLFAAMCIWSFSTFLACMSVWLMRAMEFIDPGLGVPLIAHWLGPAAAALLGIAGIALIPLARPHPRLESGTTAGVILAVLAYLGLAGLWWSMFTSMDRRTSTIFVSATADDGWRTLTRIGCGICAAIAVLGISKAWQAMQSRSVLMRSGRLDRQSTPSLLAAIGIAAMGDILWLVFKPEQDTSIEGSLIRIISVAMIGVGSMLMTVGIAAILIDVVKLRHVILAAPLSFDDMTRPHSSSLVPVTRDGGAAS